ncbi:SCO-spondin protein [Elysia marginata]|uniref:SCO-spondin protein n=1 Tax=Elysia marginata TaxID=1093978 RepID=A0AAV4EHX1_9GAST|nr:SCO-spondin protein [Elysia marginata]
MRDVDHRNFFDSSTIPEGGELVIQFTGSLRGFTVDMAEIKLCLPEIQFCRLGYEEVLEALKFLPAQNVLGLNSQNETVEYGDRGDYLESGVTITGSCYECLCANYTLECFEKSDCHVCPSHSVECVGECSSAVEVVTYSKPGVHPYCLTNSTQPCVPDTCTTPHACPGPWSAWSPCSQQCQQFRSRECGPGCPDSCSGFNLTEAQACESCSITTTPSPTTPHECKQNEVYVCITAYDQCLASCSVIMKQSVCDALLDDGSCVEKCACAEGYLRNAYGQCVRQAECECYEAYNSSTPIPQGYKANVSECEYCECSSNGYKCHERDECCELGQWTDWTPCSKTCGLGTRMRERTKKGNGCNPEEQLIETQTCQVEECPCMYNGQVWESGRTVEDKCKSCECKEGEFVCSTHSEPGKVWKNEECTKECYCNETGFEVCFTNEDLNTCKEVRDNCNSETHKLEETDDPCCPKCVPIMTPCGYKAKSTETLTVTGENGSGNCTAHVEMGTCSGTCGPSSEAATRMVYKNGLFQLYTEPDCSCCKAVTSTKIIPFACEDGTDVSVTVGFIKECMCDVCTGSHSYH